MMIKNLFMAPPCSIYSTCWDESKEYGNSVVQLATPLLGGFCTGMDPRGCLYLSTELRKIILQKLRLDGCPEFTSVLQEP